MELRLWRMATARNVPHLPQSSLVAALTRLHYDQGEKRLMQAVLIDALTSIEGCGLGRGAKNWGDCQAAVQWILAQDARWIFSFENICLALDIDPVKLRAVLCVEFPTLFLITTRVSTFRPKASVGRRSAQG